MAKVTLLPVESILGNPRAAALALNENFARIAAAMELTLSRDGTAPNQMEGNLDLNGSTLYNAVIGGDVTVEIISA